MRDISLEFLTFSGLFLYTLPLAYSHMKKSKELKIDEKEAHMCSVLN